MNQNHNGSQVVQRRAVVWVVRMAFWRGQDRNCALDNGVGFRQTVLGCGDERNIARSDCSVKYVNTAHWKKWSVASLGAVQGWGEEL